MRRIRIAIRLMTILPLSLPERWLVGDSGRAAVWYPFVGLVIGALIWATWQCTRLIFPPLVTGILTLLAWTVVTGGLHLDGLTDSCDGLFASVEKERRLEIMDDPHVGVFGMIGLTLVLLLKAAALAWLSPLSSFGILLATTLARWCILLAGLLPPARSSGMGADFAVGFRRSSILWGALLPLGIGGLLGLRGMLSVLVGLIATGWILWLAKSRIQGMTGDVLGMIIEVVETVVLLIFSAGG